MAAHDRAFDRSGEAGIDPVAGEEHSRKRRFDRRPRRLPGGDRERRALFADDDRPSASFSAHGRRHDLGNGELLPLGFTHDGAIDWRPTRLAMVAPSARASPFRKVRFHRGEVGPGAASEVSSGNLVGVVELVARMR